MSNAVLLSTSRDTYLHVIFEHVGRGLDLDDVVNDEFAESSEIIASFVQLFDLTIFIHRFYARHHQGSSTKTGY